MAESQSTAPTLTDEMRARTRNIHGVSDKLVNLKLLVALTNKKLYGRALLLFYYIYAQLETLAEAHKDAEAFRGLHAMLSEFARADGIAKDLQFYLGDEWSATYQPTPAVQDYVNHLKELEKKDPTLLLPYFYHMYMAMLSGGQMIKKMVARSFEPPEGEGLNAFVFATKSNMELKDRIKEKINAVTVDEATKTLLLEESVTCFKMNNKVVRSLDGTGNQFLAWLLKWIIVFSLIIGTYFTFIHGSTGRY